MEIDLKTYTRRLFIDFVDVQDQYYNDQDLICYYQIDNYQSQQGDRIGIFKMGWKSLKDYILFEWVKDFNSTIDTTITTTTPSSVVFKNTDLPKDIDDDYQFCYISNENTIQGVSKPFQIITKTFNKITVLMQLLSDKDHEIIKLREENAILKESLRAIIEQRHHHHQQQPKQYQQQQQNNDDIKQLKEITNKLMNSLKIQQNEIDTLKMKFYTDKNEWKNLVKEKEIVERKFQTLYKNYDNLDDKRIINDVDFNFDDLQSMPPFPL